MSAFVSAGICPNLLEAEGFKIIHPEFVKSPSVEFGIFVSMPADLANSIQLKLAHLLCICRRTDRTSVEQTAGFVAVPAINDRKQNHPARFSRSIAATTRCYCQWLTR